MNAVSECPLADDFYARFYRDKPEVLLDRPGFAILWKPHFMHSAPLREGDAENLLCWYLSLPQAPDEARRVAGKKPVERGLLHRLDFATAGLVLVAKTQRAFDFLFEAQARRLFAKSYRAFCDRLAEPDARPQRAEGGSLCVKSRFRTFGPAGREVRPVFSSDMAKEAGGKQRRKRRVSAREYSTSIAVEETSPDGKTASVLCSLSLGFRHQVRAHLASIGLPVCGDLLYNPLCKPPQGNPGFMRLVAFSLSFPDPRGAGQVSFSLPQASKTSL